MRLSHIEVNKDAPKPMVVLHGLLGSKTNWRGLCQLEGIAKHRKCYLVEMRNHATSDHHPVHNYNVMAEDVIRFADSMALDKFTVMGHSMGARTAMTLACHYPERIDGVVSVDAAPKNEQEEYSFGSFAEKVIDFMCDMQNQDQVVTYNEAIEKAKSFFNGKPQLVTLVHRSLVFDKHNGKDDPVKFAINLNALKD